jgi:bla regulator protein blaR1
MNTFASKARILRRILLNATGFVVAIFALVSASAVRAQTQQSTAAPSYEYEVAIILPSKPGGSGVGLLPSPDGLVARNATLRMLITAAYGVENYQISAGPSWFTADHYDIDAKMDASVADSLQKLSPSDRTMARQLMLQKLLMDRFKLTIHHENSEGSVYSLVIAKNGSKLTLAKPGDTYPDGLHDREGQARGEGAVFIGVNAGALTLTGQAVPITNLISLLARYVDRPILDRTGLTGKFDFFLQFTANQGSLQASGGDGSDGAPQSPNTNAPYLLTAVQEQLGLKLEQGKGPVQMIVIDRVEKPSGN